MKVSIVVSLLMVVPSKAGLSFPRAAWLSLTNTDLGSWQRCCKLEAYEEMVTLHQRQGKVVKAVRTLVAEEIGARVED